MKKIALALFVCTTLFASCKKDKPAPTPEPAPVLPGSKSYIKATYNNKTLETRDTIYAIPAAARQLYPILMRFNAVNNDLYPNTYDKTFAINSFSGDKFSNGDFEIVVGGLSFSNEGSRDNYVGYYKTTVKNSPDAFYIEEVKSKDRYTIDEGSVIIITHDDQEYTQGTMTLFLSPGGTKAQVEFKIYKKL